VTEDPETPPRTRKARTRAAKPASEPASEPAVGDAFGQFGRELTDALHHEVAELREELVDRARDAAKGTGMLAAAGAAGAVAAAALLSVPVGLARRLLPPGVTALSVAAGAGAASAYLAKQGLDQLGAAMPAEAERLKEAARAAASDGARRVTGAA
jgi:hypothetical protein